MPYLVECIPKTVAPCAFKVVTANHELWDDYVDNHPQGSIFHTSGMVRAFYATPNIHPYAIAATDDAGKIIALVVSVHVHTLRDLPSVAARAIQYAEPLCDATETGVAALRHLIAFHDDYMRSRALFCEIRSLCDPECERQVLEESGYEYQDYINYLVNLTPSTDDLWSNVNKRMRQKINSTFRKGIEIRDDTTDEGVDRLYPLLQQSYSRAGVPLVHRDLFTNVLKFLPKDVVRIRTAFDGDQPVASVISLVYGGRVFSWYGGTLRLNAKSPFACIVWDDMKWGSENGQRLYDFGGAGWPKEDYGPRKFKAEFGGDEVRFGRYRLTYSKLRLRLAEFAYGVSRRFGAWSGLGDTNGEPDR